MPAIDVGRICLKRAGREAGRKAVVVDVLEGNFVLIDGLNVKRRKCNVRHLFPLAQKLELKKGASHEEIVKLMERK